VRLGGFARVSPNPWCAKGWHWASILIIIYFHQKPSKFPDSLYFSRFIFAEFCQFCQSKNSFNRGNDPVTNSGRHCITRNARDVTDSSRIWNGHMMDCSATIKHDSWHQRQDCELHVIITLPIRTWYLQHDGVQHSLTSLGCRLTRVCIVTLSYVNVYAWVGHARGYGLQFADKRIQRIAQF
jgi:hypothetical protein